MKEIYFQEEGVVSLWGGQVRVAEGSNFLRDDYGVDYYDPDQQECIIEEYPSPIAKILSQLSYAESFQAAANAAAKRLGISKCLWVMAQYDFDYNPELLGIYSLSKEPFFLGKFRYVIEIQE